MIDMGGASAQIAFELPMDDDSLMKGENDENVEIVNLGSRNDGRRFLYRIFVTTFLGFGVNEGAKKYEKFLWEKLKKEEKDSKEDAKLATNTKIIEDGCLPVNFLKLTSIEEEEEEGDQQFVRKGNGNWDQCVSNIANLVISINYFLKH
jgi:Golgi nucleoside diphosphatase